MGRCSLQHEQTPDGVWVFGHAATFADFGGLKISLDEAYQLLGKAESLPLNIVPQLVACSLDA